MRSSSAISAAGSSAAGSGSRPTCAAGASWVSSVRAVSSCVSSSRRFRSVIDAFSHDAHASGTRGRVSASSGSCRAPSRSIHWCVRRARISVKSPMAASTSPGFAPRGWVDISISTTVESGRRGFVAHGDATDHGPHVLDDVATLAPLGRGERGKRQRGVDPVAQLRGVDRGQIRRARRRPAIRRTSPLLATRARGRRARPRPRRRCLRAAPRVEPRRRAHRDRSSSASTRSTYSASLSWPVDSASPKLTFGRGEKPSVNASGSCATRNARSSARATSRWLIQRTLPSFVYWSRTGFAAPPLMTPVASPSGLVPRKRTGTSAAGPRQVLAGALRTARGRQRRRHDVLEGVVGAHPAVVARSPPAIGEPVLGEGRLPVVPEEIGVQAGRDVRPGQHLVAGAVPGHEPVGVEALGVHGVEPAVEGEALAPLLERAARAPDPLDDPADPPVATRRDALGEGGLRVVPLHLRAGAAHRVAQQA